MIGRAYIYGLGAGGQAGVAKAIQVISNELSVTMGLCGINNVKDVSPNILVGYQN
jgi:L-lactate dehydrogenase (cytochrome)